MARIRKKVRRSRNPMDGKTDLRKNHLYKWNLQPNNADDLKTNTGVLRLKRRRKP
jgi:hypothetical protein